MVNPTPAQNPTTQPTSASEEQEAATPLRCFLGAIISTVIGVGLYFLMVSIHAKFAATPVPTTNITTINISIAVRTLVVGLSALGMVTFGIASVGLTGLGIQLLMQNNKPETP